MSNHTTRLTVSTTDRLAVHDVTDAVVEAVPSGAEGVCTVFSEHTTAGLLVNEPERRLLDDVESFLSSVVADEGWEHDALDGNADAHLRAMLLSNSVTVPLDGGELALGRWQAVLLVECDGPRERRLRVVVH